MVIIMFKNKYGKVRSGWKIAAVTGIFLAVTLLLGSILGAIIGVILVAQGHFDMATMDYTETGYEMISQTNIIGMFIQEIVMIFTPIIAWKYVMKRPLSNMGLTHVKKNRKDLSVGLLFGLVSMTIVFILLILTNQASVETWIPTFSSDIIVYLLLFILVGLGEEIYGRGFIMSVLRQTQNIPAVLIISSVFFALLHGANNGIGLLPLINLALVGLLFAYMYLRSGNIWMPIGYHITWNYFQGNIFGFKVSGTATNGLLTTSVEKNTILNGGDFGPEGGLFVTAIILIGFIFVKYYYRNSEFDFLASEPEVIEAVETIEIENED
ncbi:MAG TPA: CPBP family intramembrane metalloprotease [Clostridiales bacterium]|nr:CPBP family intramembrane metalloprotease [Clostridiales bacterium]